MYRWQFWQHYPISETKFVCEDNSKLTFKAVVQLLCGFVYIVSIGFLYQPWKCWLFDLKPGVITSDFCKEKRENKC